MKIRSQPNARAFYATLIIICLLSFGYKQAAEQTLTTEEVTILLERHVGALLAAGTAFRLEAFAITLPVDGKIDEDETVGNVLDLYQQPGLSRVPPPAPCPPTASMGWRPASTPR